MTKIYKIPKELKVEKYVDAYIDQTDIEGFAFYLSCLYDKRVFLFAPHHILRQKLGSVHLANHSLKEALICSKVSLYQLEWVIFDDELILWHKDLNYQFHADSPVQLDLAWGGYADPIPLHLKLMEYLIFLGRNFGRNITCDLESRLLTKDLVITIDPFEKVGTYFQKIREKIEEFHMESLGDTIRIEQNTRLADFLAA
ncbi:MAG: hypothetical protein COB02_15010 [Candidatus Cloacimonadota bacterium]|nr:MAG: hypothetical protein COB02_15010 [Candidatus Cloacimonadota bacterium]